MSAYKRGEETLEELAERFMVSLAYGKKLRGQFRRTGQMERIEQRRGSPRKLLDEHREQLRGWLLAVPDLTLNQLREKLEQERGLVISRAQIARALKRMGLKLKKVTPRHGARHGAKPPPAGRVRRAAQDDPAGKARLLGRKRRHHAHDAVVCARRGWGKSARERAGGRLENPHHSGRDE